MSNQYTHFENICIGQLWRRKNGGPHTYVLEVLRVTPRYVTIGSRVKLMERHIPPDEFREKWELVKQVELIPYVQNGKKIEVQVFSRLRNNKLFCVGQLKLPPLLRPFDV
jgi:hypothetical protein